MEDQTDPDDSNGVHPPHPTVPLAIVVLTLNGLPHKHFGEQGDSPMYLSRACPWPIFAAAGVFKQPDCNRGSVYPDCRIAGFNPSLYFAKPKTGAVQAFQTLEPPRFV